MVAAQAAVLREFGGPFTLEPIELDSPQAGEVLVRVVGTGMCHTDLTIQSGDFGGSIPIVLGHEGAGIVEAIGPGVSTVSVGDHVVLSYDSCGSCAYCRRGLPPYCETFLYRNVLAFRLDGTTPMRDSNGAPVAARFFGQSSFASHAIATERNTVRVDHSLPLELLGPLGCGIQTGAGAVLNALRVHAGSSIAVFGMGSVGLSAIMAAKVAGCATVVAVDLHKGRRELAEELGATVALDGAAPDLLSQILSVTDGGVDHSLDTTGVSAVVGTAVEVLRPTGACGLVAFTTDTLCLPSMPLLTGGRTVMGIIEGSATPQLFIPQLIDFWRAGRFPFDRMIQHFPLSAINEAVAASRAGDVIKPVLIPG